MIQPILNSKKIKYSILNQLVAEKITPDTDNITLFIDLNSIVTQLYSGQNVEDIKNINSRENRIILSSGIANIVAHYRHYFWSRFGIPTTFYIYYSDQKATRPLLVNPSYREDFYTKRIEDNPIFSPVQNMVRTNYGICQNLFKYIIDAYFINTGDMECALLPHLILSKQKSKSDLNFVLTSDSVQYQYVNFPNTYILHLQSDRSVIVDKYNLYKVAGYKDYIPLGSELYPVVLSLSKNKKYSLDGVSGLGKVKAVTMMKKALEKGIFINTKYKTIETELDELLHSKLIKKDEDIEIIKRNFDCINYDSLVSHVTIKQREMIQKQVFDIYNNRKIMEINDRFYHSEPIMLLELSEGVITNV